MSQEVYKQQIIDRYKSPLNRGELSNPSAEAGVENSLCGDKLHFQIMIKDDKVAEVKWRGEGCAISLAAADLLADAIKTMDKKHVLQLSKQEVLSQLGIELKPSREKCALLSLECIQKSLD